MAAAGLWRRPVALRIHLRLAGRCLAPVTRRHASSDTKSPLAAYNELISSGELRPDERQAHAMVPLQRLYDDLLANPAAAEKAASKRCNRTADGRHLHADGSCCPETSGVGGFFSRWFGGAPAAAAAVPVPLGLYTWGGVGCGKTMLMDLFLDRVRADVPGLPCKRVHFHEFMLDVHKQLHTLGKTTDPMAEVAARLLHGSSSGDRSRHVSGAQALLCFDEFQVTDVVSIANIAVICRTGLCFIWWMLPCTKERENVSRFTD